MRKGFRQWWPTIKLILAVAIIGGVGWQFATILRSPELHDRPFHLRPVWLALSALLYLVGLGFSCLFWYGLLRTVGERPATSAVVRAYYIGHLGKYIPGKAWALLLRTGLVGQAGVRPGVAALTATYETLTTMAGGAMVAVVLFTLQAIDEAPLWKALGLLLLAGVPVLPGVFNRLVARLSAPFVKAESAPLPRLPGASVLAGLAVTACGWCLFGVSLLAMIQAVQPEGLTWTWESWVRHTAFMALAYVAGFLALPAPGGLGVREVLLQQFLAPQLGALAVVVVLLLRLAWTVAELVMAGMVYWLPWKQPQTKISP